MGDRDRSERTAGIAFEPLTPADRDTMCAIERDRLHFRAAQQVQGQARSGGSGIQGKDPAAASQPEHPLAILGESLAIQRARGLGLGDGHKAFSIEEGRPGRGDRPEPVAVVLIAEPNRIGGQTLGGGVGSKRSACGSSTTRRRC